MSLQDERALGAYVCLGQCSVLERLGVLACSDDLGHARWYLDSGESNARGRDPLDHFGRHGQFCSC
jgi:hypothetical protein